MNTYQAAEAIEKHAGRALSFEHEYVSLAGAPVGEFADVWVAVLNVFKKGPVYAIGVTYGLGP
jgi:hypothetical protein